MGVSVEVVNQFNAIAMGLSAQADRLVEMAAQALYSQAVATCPVDSGAMKDAHQVEKMANGSWEVTVQKEQAMRGERTYAMFVNFGTIHMGARPWFSDAIVSAEAVLGSAGAVGLLFREDINWVYYPGVQFANGYQDSNFWLEAAP